MCPASNHQLSLLTMGFPTSPLAAYIRFLEMAVFKGVEGSCIESFKWPDALTLQICRMPSFFEINMISEHHVPILPCLGPPPSSTHSPLNEDASTFCSASSCTENFSWITPTFYTTPSLVAAFHKALLLILH